MAGQVLTIGSHAMQPDHCWFSIHRTGIVGRAGRIIKTRNVWNVDGYVQDTGSSALNTRVLALEMAVFDGIDLVFSLGSSMNLLSMNCLEGTHVREFSWLTGYDGVRGCGAEGLLRRTFRLVVYGDVLDTTDTNYTSFHDSLIFKGNGLDHTVPVPSLSGPVQAQTTSLYTPVWILQTGRATGLLYTPAPATPQFAGVGYYPQPEGQTLSYFTPERLGINQNTEFGVAWSYKCWISNYVSGYSPPVF